MSNASQKIPVFINKAMTVLLILDDIPMGANEEQDKQILDDGPISGTESQISVVVIVTRLLAAILCT